jgi:RNA polymerase sigma-70 factor, ECF subfamily
MASNQNARIEEFVRLLGENQHRIFVYLMSMMHDRVAVEDVQQETNLVLWREFESFEPNSNFAAWSCRVAFNQMRAWRKKQQRDRLVFSDSFLEAIAAEIDSQSSSIDRRLDALEKCMEKLPLHHRELIRNRYSTGSAIEEIANRMDRKPDAIYRLLSRVRCSLLECVHGTLARESST